VASPKTSVYPIAQRSGWQGLVPTGNAVFIPSPYHSEMKRTRRDSNPRLQAPEACALSN
jgi:hypothetical protein